MEYVGTPYEKLLGFLIAVVVLAFYIGIFNLILMFVSFSVLAAPGGAYLLSFLGVIPLWFFAQYRAHRYLLARSRWAGIRFGLEPGAWGYAFRAIFHWALTIVTLGLWHPRLRFALAKYRHDRTFFGDARLRQGGPVTLLYPAFTHVAIGGVLTVSTLLLTFEQLTVFVMEDTVLAEQVLQVDPPYFARLLFLSVPWLAYGLLHYSVEGRRLLISNLSTDGIGFDPRPRVGKMLWITISGNLARFIGVFGVTLLGVMILFAIIAMMGQLDALMASEDPFDGIAALGSTLAEWMSLALVISAYFAIFLVWNALTHIFLIFPTWRHYAQTLSLTGTGHLPGIDQRARDESQEAGGFAEALDVGAAI